MSVIKVISRLRQVLGHRERGILFVIISLMLVSSFAEIVSVTSVPLFITLALSPSEAEEILGPSWPELLGLATQDSRVLLAIGAVIVGGMFLLKNSLYIFVLHLTERYSASRQIDIATRLFHGYHRAPLEEILSGNTSEIVRNVFAESKTVGTAISGVAQWFLSLITGIALLALLAASNLAACVLLGGIGAVVSVVYTLILNPRIKRLGAKVVVAKKEMISGLNTAFQSVRESRVMGFWPVLERQVNRAIRVNARNSQLKTVLSGLVTPFFETFSVIGLVILIVFLSSTSPNEDDFVGVLALFTVGIVRLRTVFIKVVSQTSQMSFALPSLEIVCNELIRLEKIPENNSVQKGWGTFTKSIEFDNVNYQYPASRSQALLGISFRLGKGETIGFAGTTGSGKTTLINLAVGLLRPQSGEVRLDGMLIDTLPRLRVGYVPQYIYLVDGTLRENVTISSIDKRIDNGAVWAALERAQLADFVREHPDQLDMHVGENGAKLSGGQRQRLGIARALFCKPEILVLDEGTSALDVETESALMDAIEELHGQMTILLIAHRLSTLESCDRVITLDQGRIKSDRLTRVEGVNR
jgi:ABC-type multidrug transport system fused ATPase/permease subunit